MYDFSQVEDQITREYILARISEYDIWKRYCSNFQEVNVSFKSELYHDTKPSCRIYLDNNNELKYKDFGSGDFFDCFNYIMKKYNCNYYESLNIIAADFKLSDKKINITPNIILSNDEPKITKNVIKKEKSIVEIIHQPFTLADANYWKQYHIPLEMLLEYNIFSVKRFIVYKGDRRLIFDYHRSNPIFHYKFKDKDKIYKPYEKSGNRFFYFGEGLLIEGYEQLPQTGDLLVITKAYKDVLVYKLLGYSAISFNSESKNISNEVISELQNRFKEIVIQVDRDSTGKKFAENLHNSFGFRILDLGTTEKDLSDFTKAQGINKSKELIKKIIKNE